MLVAAALLVSRRHVFDPWPTNGKDADFGVEWRDPSSNLCLSSEISGFFYMQEEEGGIRKVGFSAFWGE